MKAATRRCDEYGHFDANEARERWREQRGFEPGRSPEDRQRLRRDIQDANRDLERRRF